MPGASAVSRELVEERAPRTGRLSYESTDTADRLRDRVPHPEGLVAAAALVTEVTGATDKDTASAVAVPGCALTDEEEEDDATEPLRVGFTASPVDDRAQSATPRVERAKT